MKEKKGGKKSFVTLKLDIASHGKQHGGCEAWQMNPMSGQQCPSPDTGWMNPEVSGQDQIVQSGNYCYLSDEVKILPPKGYHNSHLNLMSKPHCTLCRLKRNILLRIELWPQCLKNELQNSKLLEFVHKAQ